MLIIGSRLIILFICSSLFAAFAFEKEESDILGNIGKELVKRRTGPFDNQFNPLFFTSKIDKIGEIQKYRRFIEEGEILKQKCSRNKKIQYGKKNHYHAVKQSVMATMRYIGINYSIQSIGEYAKFFEFEKDEFYKLTESLLKYSCSENLSVIGKKQLSLVFNQQFDKKNFSLPTIKTSKLFPPKLNDIDSEFEMKKREFFWTLELFKSFCSWSGDPDDAILMTPLVRHPAVMAMIIRNMSGQTISYDFKKKTSFLKDEKTKTVQVYCDNFICRRRPWKTYNSLIPTSLGHSSLKDDLERLYCQDFRNQDYNYKTEDKNLLKQIKNKTFDDDNLLVGQLIAIITGIPDFFVRSKFFDEGKTFLRTAFDRSFSDWALNSIEQKDNSLLNEEPVIMRIVNRDLFFNKNKKNFGIHLDINLGEFDSSVEKAGKLTTRFDIKLSKKTIEWLGREWRYLDPREDLKRQDLFNRFQKILKKDLYKAQKKFVMAPWKEGLERIVAKELLTQFSETYLLKYAKNKKEKFVNIPVFLHYGLFALKYAKYKREVIKNAQFSK